MEIFTPGLTKSVGRGMLVSSTLVSVVMFAQTESETRKIRAAGNSAATAAFESLKLRTQPTPQELKARAKAENLKYYDESNGKIFQLVGFDERNRPLYYETSNAGAAASTGTVALNDEQGVYKLDGKGINIYEWDGGRVLLTHKEFEGRAEQTDNATTLSEHATHVGGTMIAAGIDHRAKGMAYRANLKAHDWTSDLSEMSKAAQNGALISNHSYGFSSGWSYGSQSGNTGWHWMGDDSETEFIGYGQYRTSDGDWDYLLTQNPYLLPVKAAGNPRGDGPAPGALHYVRVLENGKYVWKSSTKVRQKNGGTDGFDCVVQGSTMKNTLIVAAAHKLPFGYSGPQDVKAASFSAFGPVDDGRIKPDLAGIGVDLYSTTSTGNTDYTVMSGTSMASPNVTGNLALLQQHYNKLNAEFMRSSTLRALAIHTAKEAGSAPGPDYKFGWGLLDAQKAAEVISFRNKYSMIQEDKILNAGTKEYSLTASGNEPLKVTIAWLDPKPAVMSNPSVLDDPTKMLVNDLDIRISDGTNEYMPWILDPANPAAGATAGDNVRDNAEQIFIPKPTAGATYKLTISHKGALKKNVLQSLTVSLTDAADQHFSLIATGLKGTLKKDISVDTVKVLADNRSYTSETPVEASYTNLGTENIPQATISVTLKDRSTGNILATKTIEVKDLASGATATGTVKFDLRQAFVNYDIQAKAELASDELDVNNIASTTAYTTVVDLTDEAAMHNFGFEGDFSLNGWSFQDLDKDGRTWYKYNSSSYAKSGGSFAINFANLNKGSNDWLYSNPLKMAAGKKYVISFHTSKLRTLSEPLQVYFGKNADAASLTKSVSPIIEPGLEYDQYVYEITPDEDGIFHFGFQNKVPATAQSYAIFVDDVVIKHANDKPYAAFSASIYNPTTFDQVTLKNETVAAPSVPTSYRWSIEPATFIFESGSATDKSPVVRFAQEGTYNVTLAATNAFGSDVEVKTAYITVKNTATTAGFAANKTTLFEGEQVTFINSSAGNPAPTSYKWVINPSEGAVYTANTTDTSKNPVVSFNKKGTYTVSLTAKSLMNESTETKKDYITVKSFYESVRSLSYDLNRSTKDLALKWVRPVMLDNYFESFENAGKTTPGYTFFDENNDGKAWVVRANTTAGNAPLIYSKTGSYGMVSYSYSSTPVDAMNWMITDKLKRGSEVLKFNALALFPEDLEVYVVPAPESGQSPTLAEVKAGQKIYDKTLENDTFEEITLDLKGKTEKDFFVAFFHKTKKEADSWYLAIDDVSLGYHNALPANGTPDKAGKILHAAGSHKLMRDAKRGTGLYPDESSVQNTANGEIVTFAATTYPVLTGYEVYKNSSLLKQINDPATTAATDNLAGATGSVKYEVAAIYSDGKKSPVEAVVVDLTTLSVQDADGHSGLAVYPNPSTGLFVIDAGEASKIKQVQIYDLSGRLLMEQKAGARELHIDLTSKGKGVYVLQVVLLDGKRAALKLMVK